MRDSRYFPIEIKGLLPQTAAVPITVLNKTKPVSGNCPSGTGRSWLLTFCPVGWAGPSPQAVTTELYLKQMGTPEASPPDPGAGSWIAAKPP